MSRIKNRFVKVGFWSTLTNQCGTESIYVFLEQIKSLDKTIAKYIYLPYILPAKMILNDAITGVMIYRYKLFHWRKYELSAKDFTFNYPYNRGCRL